MSLLGILGTGFGPTGGGTCDYPIPGNVRLGTVYDFGGSVGTFVVPPESNVLLNFEYGANGTEFIGSLVGVTQRVMPDTVTLANQGVDIIDLITAFSTLLGRTLDLQQSADGSFRDVVFWDHPSRVQDTGRQKMVWFKLGTDGIDTSFGPGRWGNKDEVQFSVGLVTRGFSDGTQRDIRKATFHYLQRKRLIDAIQGHMLFFNYQLQPISPTTWTPPAPEANEIPLTIRPMIIDPAPGPTKTQVEEGTNESTFLVTVPTVILLTLPTEDNP